MNPSLKRIAGWIIITQVVIIVGMTSVYKFQQTGVSFTLNEGTNQSSNQSATIEPTRTLPTTEQPIPSSTESSSTESSTTESSLTETPSTQPAELVQPTELLLPETYMLVDDDREFFTVRSDGSRCFTSGTNLSIVLEGANTTRCQCLPGYYGTECGIPESVWLTACPSLNDCTGLKSRTKPRRIIHGLNINHELEFFEMRMETIGDVVDVFIVGESNVTAGGDPSPLYLLPEFQKGFLQSYQHKILHVFIDHLPPQGLTDGWFADTWIRDYMGEQGLKRIKGIRDDDLFLLLDADEMPNRDVLLFLKLYDGYPEPIALTLRWSVYGFFWKRWKNGFGSVEDATHIVAISTMRMVRKVYHGQVMSIRRNRIGTQPILGRMAKYSHKHPVGEWNIGLVGSYAGFHCSWCYKPEGIRLKLMSAQKDDKPRWGDYPEKLDLNYIANLIRIGGWFDGSKPFFLVKPKSEEDETFAPAFIWKNKERFSYLLDPAGPGP